MQVSNKIIKVIATLEGLRVTPYEDSGGLLTIGIGHLIKENESFNTFSVDQAYALFRRDIKTFEEGLNNQIGQEIPQNVFDSFLSLSYNIGLEAFRKSTLLKSYLNNDYPMTLSSFLKWNKIKGTISEGLSKRRVIEACIFQNSINNFIDISKGLSQNNINEAKKIIEGYLYG